jgi:hypothetical protein
MGRSRDRPRFLDSRYRPFSGKNGTIANFYPAARKPRGEKSLVIALLPNGIRKNPALVSLAQNKGDHDR